MNNDAADATYWHKRYIEISQKAQDYAAKVSADMVKLEEMFNQQESAYQRGYLDGMVKRPQPLTDEQITKIYTEWECTKGTSWADLMRFVEAAHDIKE